MPFALHCDLASAPTPLRHPWRHAVGSCHAPLALRADWQQQLARARRELGFGHVRFHGLLGDDMGIVTRQGDHLLYSFFNIDRIFDFLRSIDMRPIVELSFMPDVLASDGNTVFRYRGNVTPPRRMRDWTALIDALARHWCDRYGIDEVARWPLEVWNEPNLVEFWTGGQQGYFELYRATWQALKAISPRLQVGGPASAANGWLPEFDAFCAANGCRADFISTHYYPTDAFGKVETDTVAQLAVPGRTAEDRHRTPVERAQALADLDRGGLAGAVRTQDSGDLAGFGAERQPIHGGDVAVPFDEPRHLHRRGHRHSREV